MNKKLVLILVVILSAAIAAFYSWPVSNFQQSSKTDKLKVVATFYPLADFARQIGGDRITVVNLTPPGVEPHDFEPLPRDLASLYKADVVLANGGALDLWFEKIRPELESKNISVRVMSENLDLKQFSKPGELEPDPHFWLNLILVKQQIGIIRDTLSKIDPDHKNDYAARAAVYMEKIDLLNKNFEAGLKVCHSRTVVTSHAAFRYLVESFQLKQVPIAGISPDDEPSSQQIAGIIDLIRKENVRAVFFETLASPKLSQAIAAETGAQTLELNPIEGLSDQELSAGMDYLSVMQNNLNNLRKGLECN